MLKVRLDAAEFMFEPFLATIRLLDPKVPLASIITISSPTLGDAVVDQEDTVEHAAGSN